MLWRVHPARRPVMSLKPDPIQPVPEETARVARAAFRKGNPLLKLRDELGAIFANADFANGIRSFMRGAGRGSVNPLASCGSGKSPCHRGAHCVPLQLGLEFAEIGFELRKAAVTLSFHGRRDAGQRLDRGGCFSSLQHTVLSP